MNCARAPRCIGRRRSCHRHLHVRNIQQYSNAGHLSRHVCDVRCNNGTSSDAILTARRPLRYARLNRRLHLAGTARAMRVSKIAPLDHATPVSEEVRARHAFLSEHFKELSHSQWGWVYAQHGGEKMSEQVSVPTPHAARTRRRELFRRAAERLLSEHRHRCRAHRRLRPLLHAHPLIRRRR